MKILKYGGDLYTAAIITIRDGAIIASEVRQLRMASVRHEGVSGMIPLLTPPDFCNAPVSTMTFPLAATAYYAAEGEDEKTYLEIIKQTEEIEQSQRAAKAGIALAGSIPSGLPSPGALQSAFK